MVRKRRSTTKIGAARIDSTKGDGAPAESRGMARRSRGSFLRRVPKPRKSSVALVAASSLFLVALSLLTAVVFIFTLPPISQKPPVSAEIAPPAAPNAAMGREDGPTGTRFPAPKNGASVAGKAASYPLPDSVASDGLRPSRPRLRPPPSDKTLIIVIDDVGYNMRQLEPFLSLPFPLTFAVLPGLPYSTQAAKRILAAGKELILHQPMEALGGENPGPRWIGPSMSPSKIAKILGENLDSLPGASGINNHMGSKATQDAHLMTAVMEVAKNEGIYYLDSLTTSDTATGAVAAGMRIRHWERDVFLDNSPDRVSIIRYIEDGKKKAEKSGSAVMIGHIWSADLAATLRELYPQLVEEGFSLSTISRIMIEEADASSGD